MTNDANYLDDETIPSSAVLWRRIPPWHYKPDHNLNDYRPSTASFEDDTNGSPMSAYIAEECGEPSNALEGHDGFGLVAIVAERVRQLGLKIVRNDTPGPRGHVLVVGKKTDSVKKKIKKASEWVVRCTNVEP